MSKEYITALMSEYSPLVEAYPNHQHTHMGERKEFPWKELKAYYWGRARIWDPGVVNINENRQT